MLPSRLTVRRRCSSGTVATEISMTSPTFRRYSAAAAPVECKRPIADRLDMIQVT